MASGTKALVGTIFFILACAGFFGYVFIDKISVLAQTPTNSTTNTAEKKEPISTPRSFVSLPENTSANIPVNTESRPRIVEKTSVNAPAISPAASTENFRLRSDLAWTFGLKPQRGWYLYDSLILETVKTEAKPDSPEFARAIAVWQVESGFAPTGIIDEETIYQFIKSWQKNRLNRSDEPASEKLLDAPITNFYDSTRAADLLKVERETFAAYKKMVASAAKDLKLKTVRNGDLAPEEKFLKIISAYRSREHQERLRAASPNSGRAGLAVNSPHFTGQALDIYVGGEPVSTADENRAVQVQTPVYKWLVKNAARFGFQPYYYEPWHWEYVGK